MKVVGEPGEGPSSVLFRDCTTSPINRFAALLVTPTLTYGGEHGGGVVEGAGELPGHARLVRFVQQHHLLEQVEIILTMIRRCRYLECLCNKGVPGAG